MGSNRTDKTSQPHKTDSFWGKVPVIRKALKRWKFRKSIQEGLLWQQNEHDPKELAETTPPESENIELHCSWITEAYAPSQINELVEKISKIGWDNPDRDYGLHEGLTTWIKQRRSLNLGSSWRNGGLILSRNDSRQFLGPDIRRTKLPAGVDYAYLSIRNITPSLTLVTLQFIFTEDVATSLNSIFKETYATEVEQRTSSSGGRSAVYVRAVEQKRRALKRNLDEIHRGLYSWFGENLPGYFSSLPETIALPTLDLITSRVYKRPEEDFRHKEDYLDLLFDYDVEAWACAELELRVPENGEGKLSATLFGNFNELTQEIDKCVGKDRGALANDLQTRGEVLLSLWATHNLLLSYERQLCESRDRATIHTSGTRRAIKNLENIGNHFLAISADVQVICSEIEALSKATGHFGRDAMDFEPPYYLKEYLPSFVEFLRQNAEMRAEQLVMLESRVNAAITSSGNLTSAMANLRVQRNIFFLTIAIAIMTLLSILLLLMNQFCA